MFRPLKLFKRILVVLTAGVLLFSCGQSLNEEALISEIKVLSASKSVTLQEGETSPQYYLQIYAKGEASLDDIACLNTDESVARVHLSETKIDNVVTYEIEALSAGECVISFTSVSGEVTSALICVTVLSDDTPENQETENVTQDEEDPTQETELTGTSEEAISSDSPAINEEKVEETTLSGSFEDTSEGQCETETSKSEVGTTVYVTPSGERYHFSSSCAGKNAKATTLDEAIKTKTPCKKCAGG